jgi:hypothetical protein
MTQFGVVPAICLRTYRTDKRPNRRDGFSFHVPQAAQPVAGPRQNRFG